MTRALKLSRRSMTRRCGGQSKEAGIKAVLGCGKAVEWANKARWVELLTKMARGSTCRFYRHLTGGAGCTTWVQGRRMKRCEEGTGARSRRR